MRYLRNHIISRIICFVFALHIFNVSVDTPDTEPDYVPEDLSVNDIESVVEFVLENVLHIDNAIAEHEEPDDQDGTTFGMKKIEFYFPRASFELVEQIAIHGQVKFSNYKDHFYPSPYAEIVPQPPEA
ncbi:MAG: hypothetical protein ACT4ON_15090 [Bacteroidota bacterium]